MSYLYIYLFQTSCPLTWQTDWSQHCVCRFGCMQFPKGINQLHHEMLKFTSFQLHLGSSYAPNRGLSFLYIFCLKVSHFQGCNQEKLACETIHLNVRKKSLPDHPGQVKLYLGQVVCTDYLPIGKVTENLPQNEWASEISGGVSGFSGLFMSITCKHGKVKKSSRHVCFR